MNTRSRKLIGYWLMLGVIMIFIQVMLGGITRLTGSGLSITEWNLVMGAIPPLNGQQWQQAFDQYKEFPQYKLMNHNMTLEGFKSIFWWEFIHRLWARLMGFVFLIPFIYFLAKKMIDRVLGKKLVIIFILGGLQGLLGWVMVKSGLIEKPWVNPINLTVHLVLALILYSYLLWVALELLQLKREEGTILSLKKISVILTGILFLQIFYGGLMAGNKAALFYPTFPKIGTGYFPQNAFSLDPWPVNFIENIALIQVMHRSLGLILVLSIFYFFSKSRNHSSTPMLKKAWIALPVLVITQALLGILTLINSLGKIPVSYGLLHQVVALLLLTVMVFVNFQLRNKFYSGNGKPVSAAKQSLLAGENA